MIAQLCGIMCHTVPCAHVRRVAYFGGALSARSCRAKNFTGKAALFFAEVGLIDV